MNTDARITDLDQAHPARQAVEAPEFGGRFDLHKLITADVNLADENDVGSFSERMAAWKVAITGERTLAGGGSK